ncbi:DnaJ domain-containing protein [Aspergillus multicolor]|uniref:J domain-containing protein n=1 Tax=Aspergillus multicolor TaxID=41759 RepID=UPI003CCE302F
MSNAPAPAPVLPDYYAILGVPETANTEAIKKAFRQLALATHPDKNSSPTATVDFQSLNEANDVLSDPANRRIYDRVHYPAAKREAARKRARVKLWAEEVSARDAHRAYCEQLEEQRSALHAYCMIAWLEWEALTAELKRMPVAAEVADPSYWERCKKKDEVDAKKKKLEYRSAEYDACMRRLEARTRRYNDWVERAKKRWMDLGGLPHSNGPDP